MIDRTYWYVTYRLKSDPDTLYVAYVWDMPGMPLPVVQNVWMVP